MLINPREEVSFQPPLGLAYIASYLKHHSVDDVRIIDTTFQDLEKELARLDKPDVIGIYIMTPYVRRVRKVLQTIKNLYPAVPVVAGGPHATIAQRQLRS